MNQAVLVNPDINEGTEVKHLYKNHIHKLLRNSFIQLVLWEDIIAHSQSLNDMPEVIVCYP